MCILHESKARAFNLKGGGQLFVSKYMETGQKNTGLRVAYSDNF